MLSGEEDVSLGPNSKFIMDHYPLLSKLQDIHDETPSRDNTMGNLSLSQFLIDHGYMEDCPMKRDMVNQKVRTWNMVAWESKRAKDAIANEGEAA